MARTTNAALLARVAALETELAATKRALTEAHAQITQALEQQTATSDILRVMSASPTDVQPIFDAIVQSAVRLCGALMSSVYQFDGERLHFVAHYGYTPAGLAVFQQTYPLTPSEDRLLGKCIVERTVVNVADIRTE